MKPMSLLIGSIAVSSLTVAAYAQYAPHGPNRQAGNPTTQPSPPQADPGNRSLTPPAPRGDLRGDITNNARLHAERSRGENPHQP
jgi:hypothetical protein